jgi:hypothetical protein
MTPRPSLRLVLLYWCVTTALRAADPIPINQDESKVPVYTLPDPLLTASGQRIHTDAEWSRIRRPEVLELFRTHVYGRTTESLPRDGSTLLSEHRQARGGRATRQRIRVPLTRGSDGPVIDLLLYLPNAQVGRVPVFLGLNFDGNHSVTQESDIPLVSGWVPNRPPLGITNNAATETSRGSSAGRWPIDRLLERGYGVATFYCGDVEPDHPEGWRKGLRGAVLPSGATAPSDADWGAIGAWAWGLTRAMDALEMHPRIDPKQVSVIGHSRLGKTALWAGAQDTRFALVVSNESGEGGAALARRDFGETILRINTSFPHWFCNRFKSYNQKVASLPVDQHELIALIAPRPVYVASATEDLWADPKGEFLGALGAEPVYSLFGKKGLGTSTPPPPNHPIGDSIGYHNRSGKHDITDYDWEQYMDFADRHLRTNPRAPR